MCFTATSAFLSLRSSQAVLALVFLSASKKMKEHESIEVNSATGDVFAYFFSFGATSWSALEKK